MCSTISSDHASLCSPSIVFSTRPRDRQQHDTLLQRQHLVNQIPIEREQTTSAEIEGPLGSLDLKMTREHVDGETSLRPMLWKRPASLERHKHDAERVVLDQRSRVLTAAPRRL